MVQYSTDKNALLNNNDTIYEVMLHGGSITGYLTKGNLNTQADAFGRQRVVEPFTLFDSSFRFGDNPRKWAEKARGSGYSSFVANEGLMNLVVTGVNGDEVIRETNRPFGYQPGKSLLVMNTFTMAEGRENLRQRVGYFGKFNGIYFELDGTTSYLVKRSSITGSIINTRIEQSDWNVDPLDGTGPSGVVLDITKSQIFWIDIEWLGVGSVRAGFIINGQLIVCHIFHHANSITGTYITTASLPCRYEITNTGNTLVTSTMKQICTTVNSEGGFTFHNTTRSAATELTGKNLSTGVNNPMVSIRLRSRRTDAVVVPVALDLYGIQATAFKYKIFTDVTSLTSASWAQVDSASSVEYDVSATAMTGGVLIQEGIFKGQAQIDTIRLADFFNSSIQLTRKVIDSDSSGNILTIAVVPTTINDDAIVSITWQEYAQ